MEDYSKPLLKQLKELEDVIAKLEKSSKKHGKLPNGRLYVKGSHGYPQYYFQDNLTSEKRYLHASDSKLIKQLVQAEYEEKALDHLRKMKALLYRFLHSYNVNSIYALYDSLCPGRRSLVNPVLPDNDSYVQTWLEQHPGGQNPYPETGKYLTERGELVRSKSEKILADLFYKTNIPYQYEPLLELNNFQTIYPDFILLNVNKRKTTYWAHFGLLDDIDYAQKAFKKLELYEQNGILLGKDLIISLESSEKTLNMHDAKNKIDTFLS